MKDIINAMRSLPDFIGSNGRDETDICSAEEELNLKFSTDYRRYLKEIGLACFDGHEITGICASSRLNVTEVTQEERKRNASIRPNMYVVEQANIDDVVIWQDHTGIVYQTIGDSAAQKIAESLIDYLCD